MVCMLVVRFGFGTGTRKRLSEGIAEPDVNTELIKQHIGG